MFNPVSRLWGKIRALILFQWWRAVLWLDLISLSHAYWRTAFSAMFKICACSRVIPSWSIDSFYYNGDLFNTKILFVQTRSSYFGGAIKLITHNRRIKNEAPVFQRLLPLFYNATVFCHMPPEQPFLDRVVQINFLVVNKTNWSS